MHTSKPQSKEPLYRNTAIWYTGRWLVGCYILVHRGGASAGCE